MPQTPGIPLLQRVGFKEAIVDWPPRVRRRPLSEIALWITGSPASWRVSQTPECNGLLTATRGIFMIVPQRQPGKFRALVTRPATGSVAAVQKSGRMDGRSRQTPYADRGASKSDCTAAFWKPSTSATCSRRTEAECLCKPKTAAKAINAIPSKMLAMNRWCRAHVTLSCGGRSYWTAHRQLRRMPARWQPHERSHTQKSVA